MAKPLLTTPVCIFNCTDDWRSWRVEYPDTFGNVDDVFGHFFDGIWPAFISMANDDSFVFIAGDCDIVVFDGDDNDGGGGDGNDCEANDSCIELVHLNG